MKTFKNHKLVLLVMVFFMMTACAYSYPPDNAAVLYYKAVTLYEVDGEMADMLASLQKGEIEINDNIREFVEKNRIVINTLLDASEVKNCDWGLDFSQGLAMELPCLNKMRNLSRLVIADAKIMAAEGDYKAAISRCMSLYKIARHINDRNYVCYLVAIAVNGMANNCITQIIAEMPQDVQSITRLKNQLIEIDGIPFSVKPAILGERECILMCMTPEQITSVARYVEDNSTKEKILSADEAFCARNREYYENYCASVIAAFDMPYLKGHTVFRDLEEKIKKDIESNPDATLTGILAPGANKIFSLTVRFKTHNNAIKTAIEVYLIKAKTGKLPDSLPAGLPKDLFSDRDFEYEKTADGFILRCPNKDLDLDKDEAYEYAFKVKK